LKVNTLVISDPHIPAEHPNAIKFCQDIAKKYNTKRVVFIGDLLDNHCVSSHPKNCQYQISPKQEYLIQCKRISAWYRAFPKATVIYGNHDERIYKLAAVNGIIKERLVDFSKLYNTPGWDWRPNAVLGGVYYVHGHGSGGGTVSPALSAAVSRGQSVVMGHYHSIAGVLYSAGPTRLIFGMNVGCLVDHDHPAMEYDKKREIKKPIVSIGVVVEDRYGLVIPMDLSKKRGVRSRKKKKKSRTK